MAEQYDAYGVGNALVDIQYRVEPELLADLGIAKGVMTLIDAERQAALAAALAQDPVECASGGSAANTMIGVAACGGTAYYACQVGDDDWGSFYVRDLEQAGVQCDPGCRVRGITGQCTVLITPDADRTMNTFLGVGSQISPERLDRAAIQASQYVYLEGYLVPAPNGLATCMEAQRAARDAGVGVALTLSDPMVVQAAPDGFRALVNAGVDVLFCNEDEARAYTGKQEREAACRALGAQVPVACVTCGADGALACERQQLTTVPAKPAKAVDTTGAGDLFAGGVLYGLTHDLSVVDSCRLGSYAASQVVAQFGARLRTPLSGRVDSILASFV